MDTTQQERRKRENGNSLLLLRLRTSTPITSLSLLPLTASSSSPPTTPPTRRSIPQKPKPKPKPPSARHLLPHTHPRRRPHGRPRGGDSRRTQEPRREFGEGIRDVTRPDPGCISRNPIPGEPLSPLLEPGAGERLCPPACCYRQNASFVAIRRCRNPPPKALPFSLSRPRPHSLPLPLPWRAQPQCLLNPSPLPH